MDRLPHGPQFFHTRKYVLFSFYTTSNFYYSSNITTSVKNFFKRQPKILKVQVLLGGKMFTLPKVTWLMKGILANALCLTNKSRLLMGVLLPGVKMPCPHWSWGGLLGRRPSCTCACGGRAVWLEIVQGLCSSAGGCLHEESTSFVTCQNSIGSVTIVQCDCLRGRVQAKSGKTPECGGRDVSHLVQW